MLNEFISLLETEVKNHSIYVWGAQGQKKPTITEAWIRSRETSATNANRAVAYWKKQVEAGYGDVLRAFDCSGLGIWAMQQMGVVKTDMTANGMKGKCTKITKAQLKKGDWVFRTEGNSAYHIGYVVDDDLNVIEAMGRDAGVVKRDINASGTSYWNYFGRPSYFKSEIEEGDSASGPYVEVLGGSVNVRTLPNTTAGIIGIARKGDRLPVIDNDWHYVELGGKPGWISGKSDLTKRVE